MSDESKPTQPPPMAAPGWNVTPPAPEEAAIGAQQQGGAVEVVGLTLDGVSLDMGQAPDGSPVVRIIGMIPVQAIAAFNRRVTVHPAGPAGEFVEKGPPFLAGKMRLVMRKDLLVKELSDRIDAMMRPQVALPPPPPPPRPRESDPLPPCPECSAAVVSTGVRSTTLGYLPFRDELGDHLHDMNARVQGWACPNGHTGERAVRFPDCANPACSWPDPPPPLDPVP